MTGGDSPLHPVCARTLDQGIEQESPRIEMLVDVHIQGQPALLGKLEEKIQKRKGGLEDSWETKRSLAELARGNPLPEPSAWRNKLLRTT